MSPATRIAVLYLQFSSTPAEPRHSNLHEAPSMSEKLYSRFDFLITLRLIAPLQANLQLCWSGMAVASNAS